MARKPKQSRCIVCGHTEFRDGSKSYTKKCLKCGREQAK